jgi:hypothetical protein
MRRIRLLAFALISFVAVLLGTFLSPCTWLHRAISLSLCGLLSFNSTFCTVSSIKSAEEANAINPTKIETPLANIANYLLTQRSREFDDTPSTIPTLPNTNSAPPPFPVDPGPNFPVRHPDFDNGNQQTAIATHRSYFTPSFRKLSSDRFELEMVSPEGCKFVNIIRKTEKQIYQESIKFIPSSIEACKAEAFTASLQPNGERIEVQMQASRSSLIIEKVNSSLIKRTYTDSTGKSTSDSITIPEKYRKLLTAEANSKSISSTLCKVAEAACDALSIITGLGALANLAGGGVAIAGGILVANPATAPIAALVALAGGVACFAMFGGVPPIFSTLGNLFKEGSTFAEVLDGMQKGLDIHFGIDIPELNIASGGKKFSFGFDKDLEFFKTFRQGLGCEDEPTKESEPSQQNLTQYQQPNKNNGCSSLNSPYYKFIPELQAAVDNYRTSRDYQVRNQIKTMISQDRENTPESERGLSGFTDFSYGKYVNGRIVSFPDCVDEDGKCRICEAVIHNIEGLYGQKYVTDERAVDVLVGGYSDFQSAVQTVKFYGPTFPLKSLSYDYETAWKNLVGARKARLAVGKWSSSDEIIFKDMQALRQYYGYSPN